MPRKNYLSRRPPRLTVTGDADSIALLAAEHIVAKTLAESVDIKSGESLSPALRNAAREGLAARFTNGEDDLAWPASQEAIAAELARIGVPVSLADDVAGRLVAAHRLRRADELIGDDVAAAVMTARMAGTGFRVSCAPVDGQPGDSPAPVADTTTAQPENPEVDQADIVEEVRPNRRRRAVEELV